MCGVVPASVRSVAERHHPRTAGLGLGQPDLAASGRDLRPLQPADLLLPHPGLGEEPDHPPDRGRGARGQLIHLLPARVGAAWRRLADVALGELRDGVHVEPVPRDRAGAEDAQGREVAADGRACYPSPDAGGDEVRQPPPASLDHPWRVPIHAADQAAATSPAWRPRRPPGRYLYKVEGAQPTWRATSSTVRPPAAISVVATRTLVLPSAGGRPPTRPRAAAARRPARVLAQDLDLDLPERAEHAEQKAPARGRGVEALG